MNDHAIDQWFRGRYGYPRPMFVYDVIDLLREQRIPVRVDANKDLAIGYVQSSGLNDLIERNRDAMTTVARLVARLELGEMKIARDARGDQVAAWTDAWMDLLRQYETAMSQEATQ